MTFQDIFKSSFLENIASISILDMAIAMVLAFLLGLFIFFIYKKCYSGVMYSASFGVTLIALSLIMNRSHPRARSKSSPCIFRALQC